VSWQVVPTVVNELTNDPDPERARRAMKALLGMGKLDIAALRRAADGAGTT
jgi:predicted 3-demethylubiquinone-9 3-methyltransferase (glyoxalase superfamily)